MVLRLLLNFVYLSFSHAPPNATDFSFIQEGAQDFCLNCNNGGATTGSIIEKISHWLHPAPQASVQPSTEEQGRGQAPACHAKAQQMHAKTAQVGENYSLLQSKENSYKELSSKNHINFFSKTLFSPLCTVGRYYSLII